MPTPPRSKSPASASSSPASSPWTACRSRSAPGEVLAVVGENGAGKSTLMKIVAGVYQPDAGEVRLDGRPVRFPGPAEAIARRRQLIHQELNLAENLTVTDNLFLGRERDPRRASAGARTAARWRREAASCSPASGCPRPRRAPRRDSPARREATRRDRPRARHRRSRAHHGRADFQPDAERRPNGSTRSSTALKAAGRLGPVHLAPARRGEAVRRPRDRAARRPERRRTGEGRHHPRQHGAADGRPRPEAVLPEGPPHGRRAVDAGADVSTALRYRGGPETPVVVRGAGGRNPRHGRAWSGPGGRSCPKPCSASAASSRARFSSTAGRWRRSPGRRHRRGRAARARRPPAARAGPPEERRLQPEPAEPRPARLAAGHAPPRRERSCTSTWIDRLRVKTPSAAQPVGLLSGGNQQKVVYGKWLARDPRVLILDEPTRGVDVGAKAEIYAPDRRTRRPRRRGLDDHQRHGRTARHVRPRGGDARGPARRANSRATG